MDDNNQIPEIQPATEQAVIGASTVCFISLIIIYCLSERAAERLGILWIEFLLYGIISNFSLSVSQLLASENHRGGTNVRGALAFMYYSGWHKLFHRIHAFLRIYDFPFI